MRNTTTFNTIGQPIPRGFNISQNLAAYPYVPHPAQLAGLIPMPVVRPGPIAGRGPVTSLWTRITAAIRG